MSQDEKYIDFMSIRKYTSGISIVVTIAAIISIATFGFKLGLDFTGGTQLQLSLDRPADLPKIYHVLEEEKLRGPNAVIFGAETEVMVRTQDLMKDKGQEQVAAEVAKLGEGASLKSVVQPSRDQVGFANVLVISNVTPQKVLQSNIFDEARFGKVDITASGADTHVAIEHPLERIYSQYLQGKIAEATQAKIEVRSSEEVGPQIGEELFNSGGLGILCAFALVFLYVAVQFQWKFSLGAIVSLLHDTIVTLGVFALFQWDFDLTVLAAILALIGYSINDTIVIFDRIRENFRKLRKQDALTIVNISMTQTLARSIMTSMTVFLVMVVLFLFGGELLAGFSKAMLVGVVIGTYSSIYIAANTTVALGISKEDLMPRPKEGEGSEVDIAP
ncbi:MAG: protein translocase subunit SecF [Gammaproteobacteria bacterium]|nr:MAG: protein translocase subunit SecF [Gammaproteobacteria bacterium]